jgi:pyruvate formate lyase activating enzyme
MDNIKGTIFDIRRFTMSDGPGVRITIFMKGCQLRCAWCHNPEGRDPGSTEVITEVKGSDGTFSQTKEIIGKTYTVDELLEVILSEKRLMQKSGGGVTFSGGEPLTQDTFLVPVLKRCREEEIHTTIDTNGYADREVFEAVMPYTNLFLFDLKHTDRAKHQEHTAVGTKKILANLTYLLESGAKVWLRIPIVPGFNHSRREISEIIDDLHKLPPGIEQVHLIPFRQTAADKYRRLGYQNPMQHVPSMMPAQLNPYKRMFRRAGFHVVIGG